jgi:hypothetical protein
MARGEIPKPLAFVFLFYFCRAANRDVIMLSSLRHLSLAGRRNEISPRCVWLAFETPADYTGLA